MPEPEAEGGSVECVVDEGGDVEVGVGVARLWIIEVEDGKDSGFDAPFEVSMPAPEIAPSVDDEVVTEGDCADVFSDGFIVESEGS